MWLVIERYCCKKQLCGSALVSEVDSNSEWKWIGFRLVKRHCNDREFQARKSSMCLHQLMMSIVHAVVDPWHRGGKTQKNKWIALATHDQSKKYQILKENLSLYRSSKWTQGSQQVAVWNNKRSLFWNFAPVWDCYKAGKGDLTLC